MYFKATLLAGFGSSKYLLKRMPAELLMHKQYILKSLGVSNPGSEPSQNSDTNRWLYSSIQQLLPQKSNLSLHSLASTVFSASAQHLGADAGFILTVPLLFHSIDNNLQTSCSRMLSQSTFNLCQCVLCLRAQGP